MFAKNGVAVERDNSTLLQRKKFYVVILAFLNKKPAQDNVFIHSRGLTPVCF